MRAVVADDDRGTATIVTTLLKRSNLEVAVAHDGGTAWELLIATPPPAIAIIDWMMPGVDGLELCRRINNEPSLAHTHVILLTARNDQSDVVAALKAGADDYIVKPFKFEELRTRVHAGIRVASLQERVATSLAELQVAQQTDATSSMSAQAHRGWLKLAKDGVARSGRFRRSIGDLVQAVDEATAGAADSNERSPDDNDPPSSQSTN